MMNIKQNCVNMLPSSTGWDRNRFSFLIILACHVPGLTLVLKGAAPSDPDKRPLPVVQQQTFKEEVSRPTGVNTNLPALTNLIQIRDLSTSQASRGYPVRVTGVVTFNDDALYLHFIQDDSAGIYLDLSRISADAGIPPENLTRIFNHGFTTRKNGHGFGLHSGALAAKELGGALTACSEGPGRGATFTLELPLATRN